MSKLKLKSTKELTFNSRRGTKGTITREIDLLQINPETDTIQVRVKEKCFDNEGLLIDEEESFISKPIPVKELLEQAVYPHVKVNFLKDTIENGFFSSQEGDFEIVEEEEEGNGLIE